MAANEWKRSEHVDHYLELVDTVPERALRRGGMSTGTYLEKCSSIVWSSSAGSG